MVNPLRTAMFWSASAIIYLVTPHLLFMLGWVQLPLALFFAALLLIGAWLTMRDCQNLFAGTEGDGFLAQPVATTLL